MSDFDCTVNREAIDYGMVKGDARTVFIKTGLGGDCFGYGGKYLKMAFRLRERYGCSVIVASNPYDGRRHADTDKHVILSYASDHPDTFHELFFFGHSNGGIKGLELTDAGVVFRKMVLVNMPLMINLHKTKRYIGAIPKTEISVVCGEGDPSFSYLPFLTGKWENVKTLSVPRADHNFEGLQDKFLNLSDLLFEGAWDLGEESII